MKHNAVYRGRWLPYLFLLPTLLILLVFLYYPALQSFVLSTYRSNLFLGTRNFIGLENFRNIFTGTLSPIYIQVMIQTVLFAFLVVTIGIALSVVVATFASQPVRGARVYQLMLIWPFALSPAVAGTIFLFLFNPEVGSINQVLGVLFGIEPRWLDNPILAYVLVISAAVWKNLGYNVVFYLAALRNIPASLSEAAEIDGAGPVQRFFAITLPLLSPMTFFLVFTNLTFSLFSAFGIIDIITKGGPIGPEPLDNAGITTTMIYRIFQDGFGGSSNVGFAAAQSILLLFFVALMTFLQFRYGDRRVQYGGA